MINKGNLQNETLAVLGKPAKSLEGIRHRVYGERCIPSKVGVLERGYLLQGDALFVIHVESVGG